MSLTEAQFKTRGSDSENITRSNLGLSVCVFVYFFFSYCFHITQKDLMGNPEAQISGLVRITVEAHAKCGCIGKA